MALDNFELDEKTKQILFNKICNEAFPKEFGEYLHKEILKELIPKIQRPLLPFKKKNESGDLK